MSYILCLFNENSKYFSIGLPVIIIRYLLIWKYRIAVCYGYQTTENVIPFLAKWLRTLKIHKKLTTFPKN